MTADSFYESLKNNIENDIQCLASDEQLAVYYFTPAGQAIILNDIGYQNPNLIWLHGFDAEQNSYTILIHMSSVQLVLRVTRQQAEVQQAEAQRTIGFRGQRG